MILLLDNYDSFTYNIYQYLKKLQADVEVIRNDQITVEQIAQKNPSSILFSPGPGRPDDAGIMMKTLSSFAGKIPILGVCLGHQAIGLGFGGKIIHAKAIVHGKTSNIEHDGQGVFKGIPSPFVAVRYHSLVIDKESFPDELVITATSDDGEIMGVRHRSLPIEGVQFHPESIGSEQGYTLLANYLTMIER